MRRVPEGLHAGLAAGVRRHAVECVARDAKQGRERRAHDGEGVPRWLGGGCAAGAHGALGSAQPQGRRLNTDGLWKWETPCRAVRGPNAAEDRRGYNTKGHDDVT